MSNLSLGPLDQLDPLTEALRQQRIQGLGGQQDPVKKFIDSAAKAEKPSVLERLFLGAKDTTAQQKLEAAKLSQAERLGQSTIEATKAATEEARLSRLQRAEQKKADREAATANIKAAGTATIDTLKERMKLEGIQSTEDARVETIKADILNTRNKELAATAFKNAKSLQAQQIGGRIFTEGARGLANIAGEVAKGAREVLAEQRAKAAEEAEQKKEMELVFAEMSGNIFQKLETLSSEKGEKLNQFNKLFDLSQPPDSIAVTAQIDEFLQENIPETELGQATSTQDVETIVNRIVGVSQSMLATAHTEVDSITEELAVERGSEVTTTDVPTGKGTKGTKTAPVASAFNARAASQTIRDEFNVRAKIGSEYIRTKATDLVTARQINNSHRRILMLIAGDPAIPQSMKDEAAKAVSKDPNSMAEAQEQRTKFGSILMGNDISAAQLNQVLGRERSLQRFDQLPPENQEFLRGVYPDRIHHVSPPSLGTGAPGIGALGGFRVAEPSSIKDVFALQEFIDIIQAEQAKSQRRSL